MTALAYLRIIVAGLLSQAWRILRGSPCPCPHCTEHRAFQRDTEAAYHAAVLRNKGQHYVILDETRRFAETGQLDPLPASYFATLDEARKRRGV